MPVTPLPGADCKDLLESLRYVYTGAVNARSSGGGEPHLHYNAYIGWAFEAVRMLRGKVAPADLEQLVLTRSFWALQASGTSTPANRARLVDVELDERVSALEATCKDLEAQIDRWSRDGTFVVADTSFYIQHPQGIDDLDLREHLHIREEAIHLLVPILVVDELDGLKQAKDGDVRGRARRTLAILDRALPDPTGWGLLRKEDFSPLRNGGIPRGEMTVELVLDPPGHVRLPIVDVGLLVESSAIA